MTRIFTVFTTPSPVTVAPSGFAFRAASAVPLSFSVPPAIALALTGFQPNPIIGAEGFFRTDLALNAVLAAIGLFLLAFTTKGEGTAAAGLFYGAMLAIGLAAVGYIQLSDYPAGIPVKLFNLVVCNFEVVYLFAGTAVILAVCGMMNTSSRQVIRD